MPRARAVRQSTLILFPTTLTWCAWAFSTAAFLASSGRIRSSASRVSLFAFSTTTFSVFA